MDNAAPHDHALLLVSGLLKWRPYADAGRQDLSALRQRIKQNEVFTRSRQHFRRNTP